MSHKQAVLEAVQTLPDAATWGEITDAVLRLAAHNGSATEVARLYRGRLTADDLAAYMNPTPDVSLDAVVRELAVRGPR